MEGEPSVAVVIPTFGRAGPFAAALRSLEGQQAGAGTVEVIVVDDCSPQVVFDQVRETTERSPLDVRLLRTPTNSGPAAARNVGWRASRATVVAFIDDDCVAQPGWLEAGTSAMVADPTAGVVQGRTTTPDGVGTWGLEDWYLWRVVDRPDPHLSACNIFYRRAALEDAGGFDEDIGWWGEDTALGWRVIDAGWGRGYAADATAEHPVERRGFRWFLANGLDERNLVTLAARHPGFRAEAFWRPWAYRRRDAALTAALVALVVSAGGRRRWPALVGAVPYLCLARPSIRRRTFPRLAWQIPLVDLSRLAGHLVGSIRSRTLVL